LAWQMSYECISRGLIYKNSVRTSQETRYISMRTTNQLTLFREIIAVCCVNPTKHTNALLGRTTESLCVKIVKHDSLFVRRKLCFSDGFVFKRVRVSLTVFLSLAGKFH
jgi:hypothetical protein